MSEAATSGTSHTSSQLSRIRDASVIRRQRQIDGRFMAIGPADDVGN
ncbi:hypothetical protein X737_31280 [Mesorhizobium sp. L48C026A00]|nr:hypothetical protein X737_31280 [Mesorhizobium sp. L48C026A00]